MLGRCYQAYCGLFSDDPQKMENLHRIGAGLFSDLKIFMQDAFYINLGRVLDPAQTRGNVNASFYRHLTLLREEGYGGPQLDEWESRIKRLKTGSTAYRNKRVAHADEGTLYNETQLVELTGEDIERGFEALQDFIDRAAPIYGFKKGFRYLLKTPPKHAQYFHKHIATIDFENEELAKARKEIKLSESLSWAAPGRTLPRF